MTTDWTELEIFKGIDLNDSFVLGWSNSKDSLTFDIEASIWPDSEHYSDPKPGEYTCYKPATIKFYDVVSIEGIKALTDVIGTQGPDGSTDYGNIDSLFATKSGFELSGEFGKVQINGGKIEFIIHK